MISKSSTLITDSRPWWHCRWCGDNCPRWGNDVCPMRPQQLPTGSPNENRKWRLKREGSMKWTTNTQYVPPNQHRARCGHLFVRIVQYDNDDCEWFVEPDDEDKSYRRALANGHAKTVEVAKEAAAAACTQLATAMLESLQDDSR